MATGDPNTYSSSDLGINWVNFTTGSNGNDQAGNFDGQNGQQEGLQLTFQTNAKVSAVRFGGLDWAFNTTTNALIYEVVEVYKNGVLRRHAATKRQTLRAHNRAPSPEKASATESAESK